MSKQPTKPIVIRPEQRTEMPAPAGAPFRREQAFADDQTWVGIVTTEPGACSPWHHHGEYDTYVYLLEGEATVEFGDEDDVQTLTVTADDSFALVPAGLPHREINTGSDSNRMVIFRVGEGPAVVPVSRPT